MVEDLPEMRVEVLQQLAYEHPLTFSDLRDSDIPSNRFAYHLQQLVEDGYITKVDDAYTLTDKGETYVSRLSEDMHEEKEQPILGIIVIIERGGELLVSKRKKEPFKGYTCSGPHGRISADETPEDAGARIVKERTGLQAEQIKLNGIWIVNTVRDGEPLYSHYHFIARCNTFSGELQEETTDFKNTWIDREDMAELNMFTEHPHIMDIVEIDGFTIANAERFQNGNELTDLDVLKTETY